MGVSFRSIPHLFSADVPRAMPRVSGPFCEAQFLRLAEKDSQRAISGSYLLTFVIERLVCLEDRGRSGSWSLRRRLWRCPSIWIHGRPASSASAGRCASSGWRICGYPRHSSCSICQIEVIRRLCIFWCPLPTCHD